MKPRVGSLFTGYGGLDLAIGGDLQWVSEIESAACKVIERNLGAPNLGNIKDINWHDVAPIDILTGGYPCQPFSHAGLRKGTNDDRHLWPYVRDAISILRPRYAILENVRGHLTLGLKDVLGELAEVGYDAKWGVVRASDAGAPHRRERVFIIAYPSGEGLQGSGDGPVLQEWCTAKRFSTSSSGCNAATDTDSGGHGQQQDTVGVEELDRSTESETQQRQRSRSLAYAGGNHPAGSENWGQYSVAIRKWELATGRKAPAPTTRTKEKDRLNPVFVEWMMGLPKGWVTGHGLTSAQELKMLGNGVVPQQARLAISTMV